MPQLQTSFRYLLFFLVCVGCLRSSTVDLRTHRDDLPKLQPPSDEPIPSPTVIPSPPPNEARRWPKAIHLEYWMTQLRGLIGTRPLNQIAIPGSHDSSTYGITRGNPMCRPEIDLVMKLKGLLQPLPEFISSPLAYILGRTGELISPYLVYSLGQTQSLTHAQQLRAGVRYFDLRLCRVKPEEYWVTHGFTIATITDAFEAFYQFAKSHPLEVLILDVQHVYGFEEIDHIWVKDHLTEEFGNRIADAQTFGPKTSLGELQEKGRNIIIYYPDGRAPFWPRHRIYSPWPNSHEPEAVLSFLEEGFTRRPANHLHIAQNILNPDEGWIRTNYQTLRLHLLNQKLRPKLPDFLQRMHENYGVNVAMMDWVEAEITAKVVELNRHPFPKP